MTELRFMLPTPSAYCRWTTPPSSLYEQLSRQSVTLSDAAVAVGLRVTAATDVVTLMGAKGLDGEEDPVPNEAEVRPP